jgi:K+-sensing histidine kinase KdpD
LCKYVISRHQGLIWHEHVVDGGAKFCLQFPTNLISYKIKQ